VTRGREELADVVAGNADRRVDAAHARRVSVGVDDDAETVGFGARVNSKARLLGFE